MASGKPFFSDCVGWPVNVDLLHELIDSSDDISRASFLTYADNEQVKELETQLGYCSEFKMANDYHVGYYEHKLTGIRYFKHSAIEYVFADQEQLKKLAAVVEAKMAIDDLEQELPLIKCTGITPELQRLAFVNEWGDGVLSRLQDLTQTQEELDSKAREVAQSRQILMLRGVDCEQSKRDMAHALGFPDYVAAQAFLEQNKLLYQNLREEGFEVEINSPVTSKDTMRLIGASKTELIFCINETRVSVYERKGESLDPPRPARSRTKTASHLPKL